jgi:hypothetical protein
MARKIDDQLKAAIARLSPTEKDKLLFRLIPKDAKLMRKLTFELLDGGEADARDERAAELRTSISNDLPQPGESHYTPGYLLLDLRHWNARITEHVQATKDKFSEVALPVFMIRLALERHYPMIQSFPEKRSATLAPYLVRRMEQLIVKADKLHEDYHIEFRRDLNEILQMLWAFKPTARLAEKSGLAKKW